MSLVICDICKEQFEWEETQTDLCEKCLIKEVGRLESGDGREKMKAKKSAPALFDVVVYESATRTITNIVGKAMQRDTGHFNAEKRLETMHGRMNDNFDAAIVPSGGYEVGDILKP